MNKESKGTNPQTDSELSLEDAVAEQRRGVKLPKRDTQSGYNPYDAPPATPTSTLRRPKDLRKLSEWIRLQKQVEDLKNDPEQDPPGKKR